MLPLLLLSLPAFAGPFHPVFTGDVAASYWDEGLRVSAAPGLEAHLWGEPDSVLFGSTFLRFDTLAEVTPSYARLGPRVTFSPIAILEVSAHWLGSAYVGTFSSLEGFSSPDTVYTDAVVAASPRGPGLGSRWGTDATLQGKVGPIVVASWGELQGWDTWPSAKVQGDYYWEPESELLQSWHDLVWTVNGVLLFEHDWPSPEGRKIYVGAMANRAASVDTGDVWARVGPMVNFSVDERWSVLVLVQPYLQDRIYTTPLPPYVAARLRWSWKARDPG